MPADRRHASVALGIALALMAVFGRAGGRVTPGVLVEQSQELGGGGGGFLQMCATACRGLGHGAWGSGGSARTCAICRLADKQTRLYSKQGEGKGGVRWRTAAATTTSLGDIRSIWHTVEEDEYGVATPTVLPAGEDDNMMVNDEGMVHFPEEFDGCFDHGDSDGFRTDRVSLLEQFRMDSVESHTNEMGGRFYPRAHYLQLAATTLEITCPALSEQPLLF